MTVLRRMLRAASPGRLLDPLLLLLALTSAVTLFACSPSRLLLQAAFLVPLFIVAADREYLARRNVFFRRLWNVLSFLYLPVLLMDLRMSGEVTHPIARLLFFLQAAKLCDRRTSRDRFQLIAISFFQILAASVLTTEAPFLLGLLLFMWIGLSTLMTMALIRDGGESASPPPPIFRMTGLMMASAGLIALFIFFLVPRLSMGYLQGIKSASPMVSGFSEQIDLDHSGVIRKDASIVMRVRRRGGVGPIDRPIYWRGIAYSKYDGRQWVKSPGQLSPLRVGENRYEIVRPRPGSERHRFEFIVEPMNSDVVFVAGRPVALEGRFFWLVRDENGSLYSRYQRYYRMAYAQEAEFRDLPESIPDEETPAGPMLEIPAGEERLIALARQITAGAATKYDACRRIESYLRSNYSYTLDIRRDDSLTAVDDFLFNQKRGHCEFFATSMALLCRAAGIPARVVSGFLEGEFNDTGNFYIVRQEDAHAWVEAYFPREGWLSFDPSPVDLQAALTQSTTLLARVLGYWDSYKLLWDQYILTYNLWDQFYAALEVAEAIQGVRTATWGFVDTVFRSISGFRLNRLSASDWAVATAVASALLLLLAARKRVPVIAATPKRREAVRRLRVTRAYERFLRDASRRGYARRKSETPLEFARRFGPGRQEPCRALTNLYYATRFGGLQRTGVEDEIERLARSVLRR